MNENRQNGSLGNVLRANHQKLRAYEIRRRQAFSSKLDSSVLRWKSYCDLWSAGLQETGRAHRLVLGLARAEKDLADSMVALYEDVFIDEKGNAILKPKQRKRLGKVRTTPDQRRTSGDDAFSARGSVLTTVRESQKIMSEKLAVTASNIEEEISIEIEQLYRTLSQDFAQTERLGNAIIVEMERTEQEVVRAWDSYNTHALANIDEQQAYAMLPSKDRVASSKPLNHSDSWLLEMQYIVVTAYQNAVAEKGGSELARLFAKMKMEECRRRMHLREYLVAFVQRQQRLFLSLPGTQNPILEELSSMHVQQDDIEEVVKSAIEERAQQFQTMPKVPDMDNEFDDEPNLLLESPLTSEMMASATVLERSQDKSADSGRWSLCVAVITADAYLHIFDVTPDNLSLGSSSAEDAFQTLMPNSSTPNEVVSTKAKAGGNGSRSWIDAILPSTSIVLANCTVKHNGNTAEISGAQAGGGASKMFGKNSRQKRERFRAKTEEDMDEWVNALKQPMI